MNLDESRVITTRDFASAATEVAYRKTDTATKNGDGKNNTVIISDMVADWSDQERKKVDAR